MIRCEGYINYTDVIRFAPTRWIQCNNKSVVVLKVIKQNVEADMPVCLDCWTKIIMDKILILAVKPIIQDKSDTL